MTTKAILAARLWRFLGALGRSWGPRAPLGALLGRLRAILRLQETIGSDKARRQKPGIALWFRSELSHSG
eukprot:3522470-Pyramimonas_sp.AAC.1